MRIISQANLCLTSWNVRRKCPFNNPFEEADVSKMICPSVTLMWSKRNQEKLLVIRPIGRLLVRILLRRRSLLLNRNKRSRLLEHSLTWFRPWSKDQKIIQSNKLLTMHKYRREKVYSDPVIKNHSFNNIAENNWTVLYLFWSKLYNSWSKWVKHLNKNHIHYSSTWNQCSKWLKITQVIIKLSEGIV